MARTPEDARRWAVEGTQLFDRVLSGRSDAALEEETALAGWTGRHLLAHVASNADALGNLVRWAATGEETPMYSSPQQRNADIEEGSRRPASELRAWHAEAATRFVERFDALTPQQRQREVRTAQGRTVPAHEVTWMRSREVMVHAADLGGEVTFADLPADFLVALVEDIVGKRSKGGDGPSLRLTATDADVTTEVTGSGAPTKITGPLAGIAAYLAGRPGPDVTSAGGDVPDLPPWL